MNAVLSEYYRERLNPRHTQNSRCANSTDLRQKATDSCQRRQTSCHLSDVWVV